MITSINEFKKTLNVNESVDGSVIEFSVRYEKQVDGEFDNFTENFNEDELEKALLFAKQYYSNVEYIKTLSDGKEEHGFVQADTKKLMPYSKFNRTI